MGKLCNTSANYTLLLINICNTSFLWHVINLLIILNRIFSTPTLISLQCIITKNFQIHIYLVLFCLDFLSFFCVLLKIFSWKSVKNKQKLKKLLRLSRGENYQTFIMAKFYNIIKIVQGRKHLVSIHLLCETWFAVTW